MNELKFVNKKHTLEELKELLNKGDRQKYKLIIYYDRTYTKKSFIGRQRTYNFRDCEIKNYFGFPNKYLNLPVISYIVKNNIIIIIVYGGNKNGKEIYN